MNSLWIKRVTLILALLVPLGLLVFMYTGSKAVYENIPKAITLVDGDTVYVEVPAFTLQTVTGDSLTRDDLLGNIVIFNFFSVEDDSMKRTTVLHGNLKRVYDNVKWELKPNFLFVSINTGDSVDVIQQYANSLEVDPKHWITAYGSSEQIKQLADAFHLSDKENRQWDLDEPARTVEWIALVDKEGFVRKYYYGTDLGQERELQEDYVALVRLEYPEEQVREKE